jgi:hypothetical protein
MDSNRMYEQLLNLDSKWSISDVKIDLEQLVVEIHLSIPEQSEPL